MAERPVGPVDAIWLNMDRPNNLMVIESLLLLQGPADWDRVVAVIARRMLERDPVFSQRPVQPRTRLEAPHWEDDPDFDLERHLVRVRLPEPTDQALQAYVEQHLSVPLDRTHPMWQMHLVDGYHEGSVVYSRHHHALTDGIALNRVLLEMTDDHPDGDVMGDVAGDEEQPERHGTLLDGVVRQVLDAGAAVRGSAREATHALLELPRLLDPHHLGDAFSQAELIGGTAGKLLLGQSPETPFTGTPGIAKRAVWCDPFPLADVKHVGRLTGTTVNDVLMAAMAGALATYVEGRGARPEDVFTMVPVNVRPLDQPLPRELGNQFALVLFRLPLGTGPLLQRIAESHRRMELIKHSPEASMTFGLLRAIGQSGPQIERFFVDFFANKAIGVTTNVPGPASRRYLGGTRISGVLPWVPGSGNHTLNAAISTYDGQVRVGFKVDATCVPDPEKLVHAFDQEVVALRQVSAAL